MIDNTFLGGGTFGCWRIGSPASVRVWMCTHCGFTGWIQCWTQYDIHDLEESQMQHRSHCEVNHIGECRDLGCVIVLDGFEGQQAGIVIDKEPINQLFWLQKRRAIYEGLIPDPNDKERKEEHHMLSVRASQEEKPDIKEGLAPARKEFEPIDFNNDDWKFQITTSGEKPDPNFKTVRVLNFDSPNAGEYRGRSFVHVAWFIADSFDQFAATSKEAISDQFLEENKDLFGFIRQVMANGLIDVQEFRKGFDFWGRAHKAKELWRDRAGTHPIWFLANLCEATASQSSGHLIYAIEGLNNLTHSWTESAAQVLDFRQWQRDHLAYLDHVFERAGDRSPACILGGEEFASIESYRLTFTGLAKEQASGEEQANA